MFTPHERRVRLLVGTAYVLCICVLFFLGLPLLKRYHVRREAAARERWEAEAARRGFPPPLDPAREARGGP